MTNRIRINLANARELLELPGLTEAQVERIVTVRSPMGASSAPSSATGR